MVNLIKIVVMKLYGILPGSPFSHLIKGLEEFDFLPYLNWFVPFDLCTDVTILWCGALLVIYNFDIIKKTVLKIKDIFFE